MHERPYEEDAERFVDAIQILADNPANIDNLESYLSQHFDTWLKKYAFDPVSISAELMNFAKMEI